MNRLQAAVLLVLTSFPASAGVIDFDSIQASCCYSDVVPGGDRGPLLTFGNVTVDGGVVRSNEGWGGAATSGQNLYGTQDGYPISQSYLLPGFITISFGTATDSVTLDAINGWDATTVTARAYDGNNNLLGTSSVDLAYYSNLGSVQSLTMNFEGIRRIEIRSSQIESVVNFAIDTITYAEATGVPEPATWLSVVSGIGLLAVHRRRRA